MMDKKEQKIAIAIACGFRWYVSGKDFYVLYRGQPANCMFRPTTRPKKVKDRDIREVPDYLNSLDAMHEAEKTLSRVDYWNYTGILLPEIVLRDNNKQWGERYSYVCATAAQRAEAFLKILKLWTGLKEQAELKSTKVLES
jgi:hypothetical protein